MKKLLLVDFDNYLHRNFSILLLGIFKSMNFELKGKSKDEINVFLTNNKEKVLQELISFMVNPLSILDHQRDLYNDVKIIYDTKTSKDRNKKLFIDAFGEDTDGYKGGRKKDDMKHEIFINFKKHIQNIIYFMGYEIIGSPVYEADDIIGHYSEKYKKEYSEINIYSSDQDLYQLLDVNIFIIKSFAKDAEKISLENILNRYKEEYDVIIKKTDLVYIKSIIGDKSDNIKGVNRVGEKTLMKQIKQYGDIKETKIYKDNKEYVDKIYKIILLTINIKEQDLDIVKYHIDKNNDELLHSYIYKINKNVEEDTLYKMLNCVRFN